MDEVLIGIQVKSGSKSKALDKVGDRTMIGCVVDAASQACSHINKKSPRTNVACTVALLIPEGDPLKEVMMGNIIIEGPEDDVLSRYEMANRRFFPNYICRITGDCPRIAPTIITKHIMEACMNDLDYVSNSIEGLKTHPDGWDVEVISDRAMKWLYSNADNPFDREHVTSLLKRDPPKWARFGVIIGHNDFSSVKLSVDTEEDLARVIQNMKHVDNSISEALERGYAVFRF